eukprot:gene25241-10887_t
MAAMVPASLWLVSDMTVTKPASSWFTSVMFLTHATGSSRYRFLTHATGSSRSRYRFLKLTYATGSSRYKFLTLQALWGRGGQYGFRDVAWPQGVSELLDAWPCQADRMHSFDGGGDQRLAIALAHAQAQVNQSAQMEPLNLALSQQNMALGQQGRQQAAMEERLAQVKQGAQMEPLNLALRQQNMALGQQGRQQAAMEERL